MDGDSRKPIVMREPCRGCGCPDGYITETGAQDVVRCADCNRFCYNAPRTETGKKVRTVQTVHEAIKPKLRARVIERATGRCELCGKGAAEGPLHVGHLVSVEQGLTNGLTELELNNEENLAAMCAECNLGQGKQTISLRTAIVILMSRQRVKG
jgi:5-methylcytosine-specific restriction endonuclease McrA